MIPKMLTLDSQKPSDWNGEGVNTYVTTGATYPISDVEGVLFADPTLNVNAFTAPNPATYKGRGFRIKKTVGATTYGITLAPYDGEEIEGAAATYTLPGSTSASRPCWEFISDGTDWHLVSVSNILDSGPTTPTAAVVTNLDAATAFAGDFTRVGDRVFFSVPVTFDPTAAGAINFTLTLPVASTFAATTDAHGSFNSDGISSGYFAAKVAGSLIDVYGVATGTASVVGVVQGSYQIL